MPSEKETGLAALQKGDFVNAVPALESAILSDPNDFDAHLYLGAAYSQAERHTEAVETLTKAVYLQPMNAQVRYNLAVAFERAGWNEQAVEVLKQVLEIQPNYAQAQQALTRLQPSAPLLPPMPIPQATPGYTPPLAQTFQGVGQGAPLNPPPYSQQPTHAPQQMHPLPPTEAFVVKSPSIVGGILALLGISIATGLALGFIMMGLGWRIPFLGLITGWTTGKATRFFTGGSTAAGGVIAALFALLACGTFLLVIYLSGYIPSSSFAISCIFAVYWAYNIADD